MLGRGIISALRNGFRTIVPLANRACFLAYRFGELRGCELEGDRHDEMMSSVHKVKGDDCIKLAVYSCMCLQSQGLSVSDFGVPASQS